jgi:hypothetical protein
MLHNILKISVIYYGLVLDGMLKLPLVIFLSTLVVIGLMGNLLFGMVVQIVTSVGYQTTILISAQDIIVIILEQLVKMTPLFMVANFI